jgi:serine/threonine protein phosphatase PrpC
MHDRTEGNNGPGGAPGTRARPCLESMVEVDLGAVTHVGKVRKNNEDHYVVARLGRSLEPLMTNLPSDALPARVAEYGYGLIVADGMGGAAAGEVASRLAISLLVGLVVDTAKWGRRIDEQEVKALGERMLGYYSAIHSTLTQQSEAAPELSGMGTTLTVAYSFCSDLFVAHVGDSRAYLFRSGTLHRLTRDHTVAQALADRGEIPPEAVARHRYRHVLTNVLGGRSGHLETEFQHFRLKHGDCLLLCSDGLSDMVNDEAISEVLRRDTGSQEACRSLLDLALQAGGRDNVTAIVARYAFPAQDSGD